MPDMKKIGVLFVPGLADWEYGFLAGSAVDWFGLQTVALTPDGKPVTSVGGFLLMPQRSADADDNADLDALAVIGSDLWATDAAPDVSPLLQAVAARGGIVGGICGGTLALARAGLFGNAAHTSNGRDWILKKAPDYSGASLYRDVPHAVADGAIVSAPGSAPGTFALAFLGALCPGRKEQLAEMRTLFASEYAGAS